jgi:thioesterase domain-containing protein
MISKRKHFAAVREAEKALKNGLEVSNDIRLVQVREAHTQAFERYIPKPLNAPVILLRANTESDHCFYTEELGLEGLTPAGINVVPITGAHLDIFKAPHLAVMVSQLNSVLHELP